MKEQIRQLLSEAFDEGCESPYDLKEEILDGLVKKAQNFENPIANSVDTEEAARYIHKNINPSIRFLLQQHKKDLWLAGGGVLRILFNQNIARRDSWRNSDNDLFHQKTSIYSTLKQQYIIYASSGYFLKDISKVYLMELGNKKVNLITSKCNMRKIIDTFDLTICQIAFYYDENLKPTIYVKEKPWSDIIQYRICINKSKSANITASCQRRITKYINRGFRDTTGLVDKGFFANKFNKGA